MNDPNRPDFKVMGHWETGPWFLWTAAHLQRGGISHSDRVCIQGEERKNLMKASEGVFSACPIPCPHGVTLC